MNIGTLVDSIPPEVLSPVLLILVVPGDAGSMCESVGPPIQFGQRPPDMYMQGPTQTALTEATSILMDSVKAQGVYEDAHIT